MLILSTPILSEIKIEDAAKAAIETKAVIARALAPVAIRFLCCVLIESRDQCNILRKRIPTPVCALARNDSVFVQYANYATSPWILFVSLLQTDYSAVTQI